MKVFRLALVGASLAMAAHAQGLGSSRGPQWWDGTKLISVVGSGNRDVRIEELGREPVSVHLPDSIRLAFSENGEAFGFSKDPKLGGTFNLWRTTDWRNWEKVGKVVSPQMALFDCHPLENGKVFLVNTFEPFQLDGQASFWAIAPLSSEPARPEALVRPTAELFTKAAAASNGEAVFLPKEGKAAQIESLRLTRLTSLKDGFALVAEDLGTIYVFDPKTGALRREAHLYPEVDDLKLEGAPLERAILCHQPLPDGDILIAARTKAAVMVGGKLYRSIPKRPDESMLEWEERCRPTWEKAISNFPEVEWYRFSPESGAFKSVQTPEGMPSFLSTWAAMTQFSFQIDLNGKPRSR